MNRTLKIYDLLLDRFGSQGWWPTTREGDVDGSYHPKPRVKNLSEKEQFEICLGAILTQNTAWSNVGKALSQLHLQGLVAPEALLRAPFPSLASLIRSSGYFRQKAKRLKAFSKYLVQNYNGKVSSFLNQPLGKLRLELLALHGIGPETADSILLYAGSHAIFVVDAYTKRIGQRVGLFHSDKYAEVQNYFHSHLKKSPALFNEFHALFVALGKEFCRPTPLCEKCPLKKVCSTGRKI